MKSNKAIQNSDSVWYKNTNEILDSRNAGDKSIKSKLKIKD